MCLSRFFNSLFILTTVRTKLLDAVFTEAEAESLENKFPAALQDVVLCVPVPQTHMYGLILLQLGSKVTSRSAGDLPAIQTNFMQRVLPRKTGSIVRYGRGGFLAVQRPQRATKVLLHSS